ncbi:rhomboid family intramembrane serine protease [Pelagibacterium montanilacus]|uniref:rhomboid family intramembrane serine protease n=1 Tax=Pelagibacterium montanilacus TaxID=2185280 RepID=UPI000F8C5AFA|nr:rhomboid family intramembrane serine protease [Pelagibacterium montanilacus]
MTTPGQPSDPGQEPPVRQPIFLVPGVITIVLGLMWAVHFGSAFVLDEVGEANLRMWAGFVPMRIVDPNALPGGAAPLLWSGFTHAFLHADLMHLLVNSGWLLVFGTPVARRYGAGATVIVFLGGALAGAMLMTVIQFSQLAQFLVLIGASGGVSALTGAAMRFAFQPVLRARHPETGEIVVLGRRTATFGELMRNTRTRAFILIWLGLNLLIPLAPLVTGEAIPIAWEAHVGGFIFGLWLPTLFDRYVRSRQDP